MTSQDGCLPVDFDAEAVGDLGRHVDVEAFVFAGRLVEGRLRRILRVGETTTLPRSQISASRSPLEVLVAQTPVPPPDVSVEPLPPALSSFESPQPATARAITASKETPIDALRM